MRTVRFVKNYKFAENGFEYTDFQAGEERLVSCSCADSAIASGAAEEVREGKAVAPEENKSLGAAPENKATVKKPGRKPRRS